MPVTVQQLTSGDIPQAQRVWEAATDQRRLDLGLRPAEHTTSAMARVGAFGVGAIEEGRLVAVAIATPARGDDGHSEQLIPGLAHISQVATAPDRWGNGLGSMVVAAIMSHAVRRGYARAQLWTHVSNSGARRLYERHGFGDLERRRSDDNGEPIMHFVRDLPQPQMASRRAARLLCVDPDGCLLLMHWRDPVDGYQVWEPPGGGIEPGETADDAVRREWTEETGLPLPQVRAEPSPIGRDVVWRGRRIITDEDFYLATTSQRAAPVSTAGFTADEKVDGLGQEWVHWSALDQLTDPVVPDLLPVLGRLAPDGPWAAHASGCERSAR